MRCLSAVGSLACGLSHCSDRDVALLFLLRHRILTPYHGTESNVDQVFFVFMRSVMRTITAAVAIVVAFVPVGVIESASLQRSSTHQKTAQQVVVLSVQGMT